MILPHPIIQNNKGQIAPPHILGCGQVTPMGLLLPLQAGHQPIPPSRPSSPCEKHHPRGITQTGPLWFMCLSQQVTCTESAQNPPFSEKPQKLIRLLESVFQTHCPTWDNCQKLLIIPLTSEERRHVRTETQKIAGGGRKVEEAGEQIEKEFPSTRPDWGHNSQAGRMALDRYH